MFFLDVSILTECKSPFFPGHPPQKDKNWGHPRPWQKGLRPLCTPLLYRPGRGQMRYLQLARDVLLSTLPGDVAQLGERDNRTVEVRGSSPLISTLQHLSVHRNKKNG